MALLLRRRTPRFGPPGLGSWEPRAAGGDPGHPRRTFGAPAPHASVTGRRTAAGGLEDGGRPSHQWSGWGPTPRSARGLCSVELTPSLVQGNGSTSFPRLALLAATVQTRTSAELEGLLGSVERFVSGRPPSEPYKGQTERRFFCRKRGGRGAIWKEKPGLFGGRDTLPSGRGGTGTGFITQMASASPWRGPRTGGLTGRRPAGRVQAEQEDVPGEGEATVGAGGKPGVGAWSPAGRGGLSPPGGAGGGGRGAGSWEPREQRGACLHGAPTPRGSPEQG